MRGGWTLIAIAKKEGDALKGGHCERSAVCIKGQVDTD